MGKITAARRSVIFGPPGNVERVVVMTPWGVATQCHELIAPNFRAACADAALLRWKPQRIDSYNPRPIRGEDGDELDEWSLHAWCLAWDFFSTPPGVPPPGGVWTPDDGVPEEFAECFERYGFRWGGRWTTRKDVPHIEWADGTPPPVDEEEDMPLSDADLLKIAAVLEPQFEGIKQNADTLRDSLADLTRRVLGVEEMASSAEQHKADEDTGRRFQTLLGDA